MDDSTISLRDTAETVFCPAPVIEGLTAEQMAALLRFKATLTAGLDDLYNYIPQPQADQILKDFINKLP